MKIPFKSTLGTSVIGRAKHLRLFVAGAALTLLGTSAASAQTGGSGGEELPYMSVGQSRVVNVTQQYSMIYYSFHFGSWTNGATFRVTTYPADAGRAQDDTVIQDSSGTWNVGNLLDDDGGQQSYSQAIFERLGNKEFAIIRSYGGAALTNTKVVITRLN